jgi:hypothetical protein
MLAPAPNAQPALHSEASPLSITMPTQAGSNLPIPRLRVLPKPTHLLTTTSVRSGVPLDR